MAEAERLRLLYDLGCAFAARTELEELIPLVITKCREVLGAGGAAVLLLDPDTNELAFPYVAEEEVAARLAGTRVPAGKGIAGAGRRSLSNAAHNSQTPVGARFNSARQALAWRATAYRKLIALFVIGDHNRSEKLAKIATQWVPAVGEAWRRGFGGE